MKQKDAIGIILINIMFNQIDCGSFWASFALRAITSIYFIILGIETKDEV